MSLINFFIEESLPFSLIGSPAFTDELIKVIRNLDTKEEIKLPIRRALKDMMINAIDKMEEHQKAELSNIAYINLVIDAWTSKNFNSFA
jgi:RNA-binding protein YhbY